MKITRYGLRIVLVLLASAAFLHAADSTNSPAAFRESWQVISNRWGSIPVEKIKEAAEQSEVTAQYYLGCNYDDGSSGIEKNSAQAFKWTKLAAEQGMARAQMNLGWMYENSDGVEQNYTEAVKFYRLAAEQGHSMAQNNLGWLYKKGWGVVENQAEATKWFQKSAEQGEELGAENLAWMYKDGSGVDRNFELAEKWMRQAVNLNTAAGKYKLATFLCRLADDEAELYHRDKNRFPDGIPREELYKGTTRYFDASEWFKKSAEQGSSKAQYELADMYHIGKLGDDQRSNCIPWFIKATANGDTKAQAMISKLPRFYPNSELLKSVDPIDSLKQAAEQNDLNAQFDLAWRYHHGNGVAKDDTEAFRWMEKAARHEVSPITKTIDAHYYLGVMYENGEGTTNNLAKAYELYQEAAVGGSKPEPFMRVGKMYEKGEGVQQIDGLATANYLLATQFGFFATSDDTARSQAIESLLNLYVQGRGLPDDKAEIQKQLNELQKTPILTAKGQFLLGEIYHQGKLVTKDLVEADAWFQLSANQSFEDAQKRLKQLESEMSLTQKEATKARLDELNKKTEQTNLSYKQLENYRRGKSW